MITIFYDGNCPMCSAEMNHLKKFDVDNEIHLVNIYPLPIRMQDFSGNLHDFSQEEEFKYSHSML